MGFYALYFWFLCVLRASVVSFCSISLCTLCLCGEFLLDFSVHSVSLW